MKARSCSNACAPGAQAGEQVDVRDRRHRPVEVQHRLLEVPRLDRGRAARHDVLVAHRLEQHLVRAATEQPRRVREQHRRPDQHDRHRELVDVVLDRVERLHASVGLEEHRVGVVLTAEIDRVLGAGRLAHDVPRSFEQRPQAPAQICVAVGQENVDARPLPPARRDLLATGST